MPGGLRPPAARPWHREPWPWFIIGLLGAAIVASLVTVWIALSNPDVLVIDEAQYQRVRSEMRAQPTDGEQGQERGAEASPDRGDG